MKTKEKVITRTFTVNTVHYLGMDISTASAVNGALTIIGKHSKDDLLVICRNMVETDTVKVVTILDVDTREELRGVPESVFYDNSDLIR